MKIAVCVKHAIDEAELRFDHEASPILQGAARKMSTFDKNAVEEALRLRGSPGEVVVFTIGPADSRKTVKEALAMGADRAVLMVADQGLDSFQTASLLAQAIGRAGPFDAVLCSEGSSDTYTGQVPPMLAELLKLPYAGYARKIEAGQGSAKVERSLEESIEQVELPAPFAASVVSEINEPRYPTLIQIMQASKKPIEELPAPVDQSAPPASAARVASMSAVSTNRRRVMIEGPPEEAASKLVDALAREGVLSR